MVPGSTPPPLHEWCQQGLNVGYHIFMREADCPSYASGHLSVGCHIFLCVKQIAHPARVDTFQFRVFLSALDQTSHNFFVSSS
jgi:hypothetical protein